MSQALFALERRFELRALYAFSACLLGAAIVAIVYSDWGLMGICVVAMFLNGLIGQGLHKNRHKSFSRLAAGGAGEQEAVREEPDFEDDYKIARSATKFMFLLALTGAVIAYHFGQPWWIIIGAAVVAGVVSIILIFAAFWKARPA
jgi:fatty acid desaturase